MDNRNSLPSDAEFSRIENELFERITVRHRRQVVRHRLVAAAAIVVLAGAGVAAGTIANPSQQRNLAVCYSADSISSQSAQSMLPNNLDLKSKSGTRPSAAKIARAVVLCVSVWQDGVFGSPTTSPPKLQACLQDNLQIAVFPRKNRSESANEFCSSLGLSAP